MESLEIVPCLQRRGAPCLFFQIGPRIRIGGSIGAVGQNVKNAVTKGATDAAHAVGKVASNPWVQGATAAALAATGVGAPAAAAIMAAERGGGKLLTPGGNIGDGIRGGVEGAALGYGASKVGDMLYGGIGDVTSGAGAAARGAAGLVPTVTKLVPQLAGAAGGGASATDQPWYADLLGKAGSFIGDHAGELALGGLASAQALAAAKASQRAGMFQDKSVNLAEDNWNRAAPLRTQGLEGLLHPTRSDASPLFAGSQNAFARPRVVKLLPRTTT